MYLGGRPAAFYMCWPQASGTLSGFACVAKLAVRMAGIKGTKPVLIQYSVDPRGPNVDSLC